MSMIKDNDRKQLQDLLAKRLNQPVTLVMFSSENNCDYCVQTRALLEELAALSDRITVQVHDLKSPAAEQYGVTQAPSFALVNGKDYGIRYFGIPAGYEFSALIDDIVDVSNGDSGLQAATKSALAGLQTPLHLQVFVTPTCPYCPRAVRLAHQMAIESPLVRADVVEATEFPELAERYEVMGVPRTVVNEHYYIEGALPEAQFVAATMLAADPAMPEGNLLRNARARNR